MNTIKHKNTNEYIALFPEEIQRKLYEIQAAIKRAAPKAQEVISYNMPGYKQNGILVYFAGYKHHIGFYPTSSPIKVFKKELSGFKTSKGAIQFPISIPLPIQLITDIVKFRIEEDQAKTQKTNTMNTNDMHFI
jgi:uncharacterized protein YdhG (YjbR/CyaY superfamily)